MTRGFARTVARGLIGVLFMAQMAVAAYACPGLDLSAAPTATGQSLMTGAQLSEPREASGASLRDAGAQMADCADMLGAMDPSSANLCAEHCKQGQQSDQALSINVPAAVLTTLYLTITSVPPAATPARHATAVISALVAATPPHAILHCVYRI